MLAKGVIKEIVNPIQSDTDDSCDIEYADAPPSDISFQEVDRNECFECGGQENDEDEEGKWVGCDVCPRWSHRHCTGDAVLMNLIDIDDINDYPYLCPYCDYT